MISEETLPISTPNTVAGTGTEAVGPPRRKSYFEEKYDMRKAHQKSVAQVSTPTSGNIPDDTDHDKHHVDWSP
jgi:hypothetical protein